MSCPKTQHLLTEYFSDDVSNLMREEIDRHLSTCSSCRSELDLLLSVRQQLAGWREERVPHWNRGMDLFDLEEDRQLPMPTHDNIRGKNYYQ